MREEGNETVINCHGLKMTAADGKKRLTDEWDARGVRRGSEYAILTDEISRAWSGMTTGQYKRFKGLKKERQVLPVSPFWCTVFCRGLIGIPRGTR